jgi:acyl-homoserine-lactone acylase
MKTQVIGILAASVLASSAAVELASGIRSEVTRTSHGVVHVNAGDFRSLGYGIAYAYAEDNVHAGGYAPDRAR